MFVIVIINCCSLFFSYMFISPISFKELQVASWKVREKGKRPARKQHRECEGQYQVIYTKDIFAYDSSKDWPGWAMSRLRAGQGRSRQEPRGERMTVLLHQEKLLWNTRLTIRRNKWEHYSELQLPSKQTHRHINPLYMKGGKKLSAAFSRRHCQSMKKKTT